MNPVVAARISKTYSAAMKVYHLTKPDVAAAILADGFRDGSGAYYTDKEHFGVWVSDRPLIIELQGPPEVVCLAIEIDEAALIGFEWITDGIGYREWLVPADVLNKRGQIAQLSEDETYEAAFDSD